ncbi:MAG TPA: hypothetical protein VGC79_34415 [Polyangiaceae bacterium]
MAGRRRYLPYPRRRGAGRSRSAPFCNPRFASTRTLRTAGSGDAELHLLTQTAGNGAFSTTQTFNADTGLLTNVRAGPSDAVAQFDYGYDTLGNLTYRSDNLVGVYERFCYDSLNRLTNSATASTTPTLCTSTGGGITSKTVAYDQVGNITSKSDVGTYSYPSPAGGTGTRPHAVSSIAGTVNGVTNPSYTYDLNGNMTAGAGRSVTYTAFNMAATVTQGASTIAFTYDAGHARIKQCIGTSCATSTTYYLNDPASGTMVEKLVTRGTTTWHDFLQTGGGLGGELLRCRWGHGLALASHSEYTTPPDGPITGKSVPKQEG